MLRKAQFQKNFGLIRLVAESYKYFFLHSENFFWPNRTVFPTTIRVNKIYMECEFLFLGYGFNGDYSSTLITLWYKIV